MLKKSCSLTVLKGKKVESGDVIAFMKVDNDRRSILKKGSRTSGNFSLPQRTVCSRMWVAPLSFSGGVQKEMEQAFSPAAALVVEEPEVEEAEELASFAEKKKTWV